MPNHNDKIYPTAGLFKMAITVELTVQLSSTEVHVTDRKPSPVYFHLKAKKCSTKTQQNSM